jgi:hypothetical protein
MSDNNSPGGLYRKNWDLAFGPDRDGNQSSVSPPGKNNTDTDDPQNKSADKSNGTQSSLGAPTPEANKQANSSQSQKSPWWRSWRLLEGVGIFAAVTVAGINVFQWKDSDRNFRIDERAWVHRAIDPHAQEVRVPVSAGMPLFVPVTFVNSGKTPASQIEGAAVMSLMPAGVPPEFIYTAGHVRTGVTISEMYPGETTNPIPVFFLKYGKDGPSAEALTDAQVEYIKTGVLVISVHGRIEYRDAFNRPHWFTFCYEPDLGGTTTEKLSVKLQRSGSQTCVDDNKTDNNY